MNHIKYFEVKDWCQKLDQKSNTRYEVLRQALETSNLTEMSPIMVQLVKLPSGD